MNHQTADQKPSFCIFIFFPKKWQLPMVINNDIITAIIYCDYKAYLKGQNLQCSKSEFEIITYKLKEIQKQKYNTKNSITKEFTNQPYDLKNNFQSGKIYTHTL